ncbi:DUF123 domain-containing protein [Candidatus Bathyarchaeota archaeon]|nr:DUF123 domain-containing protein [Candidatus Bathyarchaeota archaeon]
MFDHGIYVYVGSAQNSLEKRIARHFRKKKKKFWHIDYLLEDENVKIITVLYKIAPRREECRIAKEINSIGSPIKGFGSSDCKCKSHLFKLNNYEELKKFIKENRFLNFPYSEVQPEKIEEKEIKNES